MRLVMEFSYLAQGIFSLPKGHTSQLFIIQLQIHGAPSFRHTRLTFSASVVDQCKKLAELFVGRNVVSQMDKKVARLTHLIGSIPSSKEVDI